MNNNNNNKIKIIVVVAIVVLIYVGIVYFANRSATEKQRTIAAQDALMISKDYMFIKTDNNWSFATNEEYNDLLSNKEFQIFSKGEYIGTYKVRFMDHYFYYVSNQDKDIKIDYPVSLYASKDSTIETYSVQYESLDDSDHRLAKSYLEKDVYYPNSCYEFSNNQKVVFDFDNDGIKEKMLFVSTGHSDEFSDSKKVFGMVLYVDGTEVQVLYKDVADRGTKEADFYEYFLISVYKLSNQDKNIIILGRNKPMGGLSYCPTLLEFNGSKLEEKATCKEAS